MTAGTVKINLFDSWVETRDEVAGILGRKGQEFDADWVSDDTYTMRYGFKSVRDRDSAVKRLRAWGKEQQIHETSTFAIGVQIIRRLGNRASER